MAALIGPHGRFFATLVPGAVKLAVNNLDGIGSLDAEQLTKLREMLTILNGEIEDAIDGGKRV